MLRRLLLHGYKNLSADFAIKPGFNVIIAPNGTGKTNLLEAIYYLHKGKSFRGLPDTVVKPQNGVQGDSSIFAELVGTKTTVTAALHFPWQQGTKSYLLNGKKSTRAKVAQLFHVFAHAPHSLDLVLGPTALRREFIDQLSIRLAPGAGEQQRRARRALKQRNALLARYQETGQSFTSAGSDEEWRYWSAEYLRASLVVSAARLQVLGLLLPIATRLAQEFFHLPAIQLNLSYSSRYLDYYPGSTFKQLLADLASEQVVTPPANLEELLGEEDIAQLVAGVQDNFLKEFAAGKTLYGAQRDDFSFLLNQLPIREYGSRGQQRLYSLVLNLAALELWQSRQPRSAVTQLLLLDDILSELDEEHRANTLAFLRAQVEKGVQVLLTSPDSRDFAKLPRKYASRAGISFYQLR